jgi:PAS domain S-box-containing protein
MSNDVFSRHELDEDDAHGPVLLVDDNPINLQILYKTLQNCGYRLLIAKDGETALEIARKAKPCLILLDIMMPGMDGYEVCATLKADRETKNIAVIFLSALEDSSAKVKGFSVGGVDYISKPFQADEVVARVRNHIKIHRLERELAKRNHELEAENQQILNAISEGIIGLDKVGRIAMINPSASVITGWSAADCLGEKLSFLGLFDSDDSDIDEEQTLPYRSYHLGMPCYSELEWISRRDRSSLAVSISCTPRAEGGAVMVIRDVSEWVNNEEALRRAREELESQRQNMAHLERLSTMGEMAAGIAHEVNQPLTAVTNYSRVAKRLLQQQPCDTDKLGELIDKLEVQAARASDVIQRVRSFVKKPNAGREPLDPNALIAEVIALAEVDSRVNDVSVHFTPQDDLPWVNADPVQIQQVALNLIRNAIEASAENATEQTNECVTITTEQQDNKVQVTVIDSGSGVDEQLQQQLFNPFVTTKANGMGVGLSICQSIVQAHGGDIGYRPNPEGGSIFYFSLPALA